MIHKTLSGGVHVRLEHPWDLWRLELARWWASWKDRRAGRQAADGGLTAKPARDYLAWLEAQIEYHRAERRSVLGVEGWDDYASGNKLEASTYELARGAFVQIVRGELQVQ